MKKQFSFRMILTMAILSMSLIPLIIISAYYYGSTKQMLVKSMETTLSSSLSNANILYDITCGQFLNEDNIKSMLTSSTNKLEAQVMDVFSSNSKATKAQLFTDWKKSVDSYFAHYKQKTSLLAGDYSVYLFFPEENVLFDSSTTFYESVSENALNQLYPASNISPDGTWCMTSKLAYYKSTADKLITQPEKHLSFVYLLPGDAYTSNVVAIVNFDATIFQKIISKQSNIDGHSIMLFLDSGNYLLTDNPGLSESSSSVWEAILNRNIDPFPQMTLLDQEYIFSSQNIGENFIVVELLPTITTLKMLDERVRAISVVTILLSIVLAFIATNLAKRLYSPLNILIHSMNLVKNGDFSTRIKHDRSDEYGHVFNRYNEMLEQINKLIEHNTNEKLMRTEAELFLLQERVNPHFIYNSLEVIYSLSKLNRVDDIPTVTKSLADFFRMSLSDGSADVPLRTALDICEKYLTIQAFRFPKKIDYTTNVDESLYQYIVPKFTIQVLVENAVVHGIAPLLQPGHITVDIHRETDTVFISVSDDGIGISLGKIEEINYQIQHLNVPGPNFALKNLNSQIVMRHGEKYGVHLSNPSGVGTCATVTLPFIEGE